MMNVLPKVPLCAFLGLLGITLFAQDVVVKLILDFGIIFFGIPISKISTLSVNVDPLFKLIY